MVYHGPSRGCRACRKRRVKCDQTHPACNNCTKRKQECPGYESAFDYRHRNETKTTISRARQKDGSPRKKSGSPSFSSSSANAEESPTPFEAVEASDSPQPTDTGFALVVSNSRTSGLVEPSIEIPFHASIRSDPESVALGWYFTNYPPKNVDPQASHGYSWLLKPLYLASSIDSPLRPAVAAIATNLLMLFCHQGGDTDWARKFYMQSISRMKDMIADPVQSKSDDLMLSTLVLNFYDMLNLRWTNDMSTFNNHRAGALALLKHRGSSNYDTDTGRQLTSSLRTSVCHWALESRVSPPPDVLEYLNQGTVPTNKASELDTYTMSLIAYQTKFLVIYGGGTKRPSVDYELLRPLIHEGLQVDISLKAWAASCPAHWNPLYVSIDEVQPTIRQMGFYGDKCGVYWDMSVCDLWAIYRMRRIITLRMVRQICTDHFEPTLADTLLLVDKTIQGLVDELCETIPFIIGDLSGPMRHAQLYEVAYPTASNGSCTFPNIEHDHPRAAASSGGWLASTILGFMAKIAMKNGCFDGFPLRQGQFKWVMSQLRRLQDVFLMHQPTDYLKRSKWARF